MTAEPWVSVDDVAKYLDVARDSVYRWIESRNLPASKIGRIWKFKISEVDAWVRSRDVLNSNISAHKHKSNNSEINDDLLM